MDNNLKNMKFSANTYSNRFLATKKQKEFIEDNLENTSLSIDEQAKILSRLESMEKIEASYLIKEIIKDLNEPYYDDYDDWFWNQD